MRLAFKPMLSVIVFYQPLTVSVYSTVCSERLYVFTIPFAMKNIAYSFTMFSKHSDSHPFFTLTLYCSTIMFFKEFAKGEAWTYSTTLSTNNDEGLPDLICFLRNKLPKIALFLCIGKFRAQNG